MSGGGLAEHVGVCWSKRHCYFPGARGQMIRVDAGFLEQRCHRRHIALLWMLRVVGTFMEGVQ